MPTTQGRSELVAARREKVRVLVESGDCVRVIVSKLGIPKYAVHNDAEFLGIKPKWEQRAPKRTTLRTNAGPAFDRELSFARNRFYVNAIKNYHKKPAPIIAADATLYEIYRGKGEIQ